MNAVSRTKAKPLRERQFKRFLDLKARNLSSRVQQLTLLQPFISLTRLKQLFKISGADIECVGCLAKLLEH